MTTTASTPDNGRPLKVLVAEDNTINQRLMVALLTQLGHTAMVVGDGEKALQFLAKLKVDLVLMDVMMPNMDGLQALARIRAGEAERGGHLPVIMATSHDDADDAARFLGLGADGYVTKPLELQLLQAEIRRVTSLS